MCRELIQIGVFESRGHALGRRTGRQVGNDAQMDAITAARAAANQTI